MTLWITIVVVALISVGFKAAGPALLGDRELPPRLAGMIALLAPALLAGLVLTDITGPAWTGVDWTLCAGLAAIAVTYVLRVPALAAILCGVVVTAALRFLI
ncbi:branched-chain amino acid ABC transporter [Amycolatopsis coloradensis]|uniref:Branched-chain amino acid ABC transporter n=1 Tax=Amycolatopsis coloradensis TaxID=76021 RepID=A0A1R0L3H5_9PSEU|nr:AzlD domain-containing protein [Amycolatopsis coloradensis]OLZ57267.1 branched-chain amino acid ABC transporter [Amycolatopsis coloradensis]